MNSRAFTATVDRSEVLARVDLAALLDSLSGPADTRRRWHCPERGHPDEHASVTVRLCGDGTQRWRCWSGGHGGTAIDAVAAAHAIPVGEALRWLAQRYADLQPLQRAPQAPLASLGRPAADIGLYVERASRLLWTPAGEPQRAWLTERGLAEGVLRANRVGADPGRRYLPRPRGLPGGWPAVVYPVLTVDGEIAYLQARYLHPPEHRGKYDSPSVHVAANPRLAWTVPTMRSPSSGSLLMVCEGVADALVAAQAGIRSVGVLGATSPDARVADGIAAAAGDHQPGHEVRVVICFDDDPAGHAGSTRLARLLGDRHVAATIVTPPSGLDLTAWAAADPTWTAALPTPPSPQPAVTAEPAPTPVPPAPAVPAPEIGLSIGGIN